ncbi:hypothetical protein BC938DRAFT_480151 [Jimgerdemannia flammicorona]|uniref:Proliferating cell nuclear antigen PCNA C-terminal domain-containing protein n=1 Tax=Jimgerdemannia flammicorona TaxID=994334 RepID=A0A433QJA2_9FUNG|nr:hypothetical protein BC938DRAFT_480151 [Jimgerdemannia flammicorona]
MYTVLLLLIRKREASFLSLSLCLFADAIHLITSFQITQDSANIQVHVGRHKTTDHNVVCRTTESVAGHTMTNKLQQPVSRTVSLRNLKEYATSSRLSMYVTLSMAKNKPLLVEYKKYKINPFSYVSPLIITVY